MPLRSLLALLLWLPAGLGRAGVVRVAVERVETAPSLTLPVLSVPVLSPVQALAPALSVLSPSPAAPVPVASFQAVPALPVPARGLAIAPSVALSAAASSDSADRPTPAALTPRDLHDGAALFDGASAAQALDEVSRGASGRALAHGVFIQQEQEGSLIAADPRDSSGSVFRYYRPVELRSELVAEVKAGLKGLDKFGYGFRRALAPFSRGDESVWNALSSTAKTLYLDKLEAAVVAERGREAAWRGKTFLLMTRSSKAPSFLAEHPDMEPPPPGYESVPGARFLQPEIVSGRNTPASSVSEALGRTKTVISDTGHAGTQYHLFVKATPAALNAQLPALQAALQAFNDALYSAAIQESFQNVIHASLQPWHDGRSRRVAALLAQAAATPHQPAAEDPDSEKHAFVGLRYWGAEDGKLAVSLELRGASLPFKSRKSPAQGLDNAEMPRRDYEPARRWLGLLSSYAERLASGRAPRVSARPVILDAAAADALLAARARQRGMPKDSYYGTRKMSTLFTGRERVSPGLLAPFSLSQPGSDELNRFLDEWLAVSARVRARAGADGGFAGEKRLLEYQLWGAYAAWGRSYEPGARARLAALLSN